MQSPQCWFSRRTANGVSLHSKFGRHGIFLNDRALVFIARLGYTNTKVLIEVEKYDVYESTRPMNFHIITFMKKNLIVFTSSKA